MPHPPPAVAAGYPRHDGRNAFDDLDTIGCPGADTVDTLVCDLRVASKARRGSTSQKLRTTE
jgi:hypothetical protein